VLRDESASADAKSAAASALNQAPDRPKAAPAVSGSEAGTEARVPSAVVAVAEARVPRRFKFAPSQISPTLEIANGAYHRIFRVEDQPFEAAGISHVEGEGDHARTVYDITPEEEARLLLADGNFVEIGKEESAKSEEPNA
jgi:hypothetical protein